MINKAELRNVMLQLEKLGIVEQTTYDRFEGRVTRHTLIVEHDSFKVIAGDTLVHYYYDNLSSLVLYDDWRNNIILSITPHKRLTGGKYREDTFHLATIEPSCVPLEGYILNNPSED